MVVSESQVRLCPKRWPAATTVEGNCLHCDRGGWQGTGGNDRILEKARIPLKDGVSNC